MHDPPAFGGKPGLLECSGEYIMASATKFQTTKGKTLRMYFETQVTVEEDHFQSIVSTCAGFLPDDIDDQSGEYPDKPPESMH